jgi:hypothetical protein
MDKLTLLHKKTIFPLSRFFFFLISSYKSKPLCFLADVTEIGRKFSFPCILGTANPIPSLEQFFWTSI